MLHRAGQCPANADCVGDAGPNAFAETQSMRDEAEAGIRRGQECFWLRGLLPKRLDGRTAAKRGLRHIRAAARAICGTLAPVAYLDGSGDGVGPRTRMCGWAAFLLQNSDGDGNNVEASIANHGSGRSRDLARRCQI